MGRKKGSDTAIGQAGADDEELTCQLAATGRCTMASTPADLNVTCRADHSFNVHAKCWKAHKDRYIAGLKCVWEPHARPPNGGTMRISDPL